MLDATLLSVLAPQCPLLLQCLHDQQGTSGTLFASCGAWNKSRCSPCLVLRLYSLASCPSEAQIPDVYRLVIPNSEAKPLSMCCSLCLECFPGVSLGCLEWGMEFQVFPKKST